VSVDVYQTIAVVRVELENLSGKLAGDSGARLSDLFQFIKIDGTWKISQKSFHWYLSYAHMCPTSRAARLIRSLLTGGF
jgi:Putative lumazine-binding